MIYTYNKMRTHSQELTTTAWQDRIRMGGCVQKSISPFYFLFISQCKFTLVCRRKISVEGGEKK